MSEEEEVQNKKIRLGPKEKEVLKYLYQYGEAWIMDLYKEFAHSKKYRRYLLARLYRLQKKGLVIINYQLWLKTGKVRTYCTITYEGKEVVRSQLLNQS